MKPADHPDFYRFPPPPGRSRESTIRLDAEGRFWHDDQLVNHAGMARAFSSWIDKHPDDGRYILSNGYDWTYFEVEDVPYLVTSASVRTDGVELTLSDGSNEQLDPTTVRVGARDALYVQVKGGRFPARFTASSQLLLAEVLREGDNGEPELEVGGQRFPMATSESG
jgi:hypothetical protein